MLCCLLFNAAVSISFIYIFAFNVCLSRLRVNGFCFIYCSALHSFRKYFIRCFFLLFIVSVENWICAAWMETRKKQRDGERKVGGGDRRKRYIANFIMRRFILLISIFFSHSFSFIHWVATLHIVYFRVCLNVYFNPYVHAHTNTHTHNSKWCLYCAFAASSIISHQHCLNVLEFCKLPSATSSIIISNHTIATISCVR